MFGGTPSNLAISIMDKAKVEVLAGVNLPMLVKLASVRETENLADAVASAQDAGRKYINIASQLLAKEKTRVRAAGRPAARRRERKAASPSPSETNAACMPERRPSSSSWPVLSTPISKFPGAVRPYRDVRSWG
jgi:hypothetical protein